MQQKTFARSWDRRLGADQVVHYKADTPYTLTEAVAAEAERAGAKFHNTTKAEVAAVSAPPAATAAD